MGDLDVEHHHVLPPERAFRCGQIEFPHPAEALVIKRLGLVAIGHERLSPCFQCFGVMQPQDFYVGDIESSFLDMRQNFRKCRNITAGEDVFADEWIGRTRPIGASDGVQQKNTIRLHQSRDMLEIFSEMPHADMFEHAHRNKPVKLVVDVAIIGQLEFRPVGQPLIPCALIGDGVLLFGQGYTFDIGLEVASQIKPHAAPPAADIENLVALLYQHLGGDVAFLGELRFGKRGVGRIEIGTGILLVGIEKQVVKLAREIVVTFDIARRTRNRVHLLEAAEEHAQFSGGFHPRLGRCRRPGIFKHHLKQRIDIAFQEIDLALHETFGELQFRVERNGALGVLGLELNMNRRAGLVAILKSRPLRIGDCQVTGFNHMRKNSTQHSIHRPHLLSRIEASARPCVCMAGGGARYQSRSVIRFQAISQSVNRPWESPSNADVSVGTLCNPTLMNRIGSFTDLKRENARRRPPGMII